jgi:phosphoglycolate phosphatase-like HAD superfamily hydrolase
LVFDMDGVVTDTARVHAAAWKALFAEVLRRIGPRGFGGHALQLRGRRIGGGPVDTIVTPSGHHAAWLFADVQGIS